MGSVHNELRRASLGAGLKKALGDSRSESGLERWSETLQPIIDLFSRPDWDLLHEVELFAHGVQVAAGAAGTFAKVGVFNPPTSNLLVTVLDHYLRVDATTGVELFPVAAMLGAAATVHMLDRRRRISHGALVHFEASAAAGADLLAHVVVPVSPSQVYHIPIILPPGQGFMWRTLDDAATLTGSFHGYQRVALPGELL